MDNSFFDTITAITEAAGYHLQQDTENVKVYKRNAYELSVASRGASQGILFNYLKREPLGTVMLFGGTLHTEPKEEQLAALLLAAEVVTKEALAEWKGRQLAA